MINELTGKEITDSCKILFLDYKKMEYRNIPQKCNFRRNKSKV